MAYLAYHFTVHPPQPGSEILIASIADMGFDAFDYSENGFVAYVNEDLNAGINFDGLQFSDFLYTFIVEKIPTTNWNEEWEKNFEPVEVHNQLVIRAPFHEKKTNFALEIIIMPKMSFGTGHHQTTRLMCLEMLGTDIKNKCVLDMGCGTGILAILAKKLGASRVVGIDIDEWSVENSLENCEMNDCKEIELRKGDVRLLKNDLVFDLILANINKNILKADLPTYANHLKQAGKIFLSGFFKTDASELKDIAGLNGLNFVSISSDDEWAMMVFEKVGYAE
jgi:ribosomal protein L11 methyltransferase